MLSATWLPGFADEYTVVVNGATHAIFPGEWVHFTLPPATSVFTVEVTGEAYYAPGRPFTSLLLQRIIGPDPDTEYVVLPAGMITQITDNGPDQGVNLFLVDQDKTDNSGSFLAKVTPDVGGLLEFEVVAAQHSIDLARAASVQPVGTCIASATGNAWWGDTPREYRDLILMYHTGSPPARKFIALYPQGMSELLEGFDAGDVNLFFGDFRGEVGDNGGDVTVRVNCQPPVPVEPTSWGFLKAQMSDQ